MMWETDCNHPASFSFSHFVFNSAFLSLLSLLCANDSYTTASLCGVTLPYNKGQRSVAALARGRKSYLHMKSDSQLGILVKPLRHAPFKWMQKGSCGEKGKVGESLWCVKMILGGASIHSQEATKACVSFFLSTSTLTLSPHYHYFFSFCNKKWEKQIQKIQIQFNFIFTVFTIRRT